MFSRFLDPKNDIVFKRIFGTEKNKDILIHFLNDMIVFKEKKPIVDVTFLKPNQDPEVKWMKRSIVDVLCQDTEGHRYVVEMQVAQTEGFEKRAQYYAAKTYTSQMGEGEEYHNLKEVIFLAIVDYVMFPHQKQFKSDHVILDRDTFEHNLKDFSFTFLELTKFNEDVDHLSSMIAKWAYFFKNTKGITPEELETLIGKDEVIDRAYKELRSFNYTEEELECYEDASKARRDYKAIMDFQFNSGKAEGREEVALNLLKVGLPLDQILQGTGLTKDQFEEILKKHKK